MAAHKKYATEEERKEAKRLTNISYRNRNRQKVRDSNRRWASENKDTVNASARKRHADNPEPRRKDWKKWRQANPDYNWRKLNPDKAIEGERRRRELNRDQLNAYQRQWRKENQTTEERTESHRKWLAKNPNYTKEYNETNKEHLAEARRLNHAKRYAEDNAYRIGRNLRCRIAKEIRLTTQATGTKVRKASRTEELLGCKIPEFLIHLEKQWQKGMSWQNYGFYGWHADHIKPVALFDLSKPEEQKACFHYTNYQPLWMKDNLSKSAKYQTTNSA